MTKLEIIRIDEGGEKSVCCASGSIEEDFCMKFAVEELNSLGEGLIGEGLPEGTRVVFHCVDDTGFSWGAALCTAVYFDQITGKNRPGVDIIHAVPKLQELEPTIREQIADFLGEQKMFIPLRTEKTEYQEELDEMERELIEGINERA